FLYNDLGLAEDDPKKKRAIVAAPDCDDLPYTLRAYLAWKLGLPFMFHDCDRGASDRPPRCTELLTHELPPDGTDPVTIFNNFLHKMVNTVHSGSARTSLADEDTDYYPVKLERDALRPGVIYADPYGHVLVIAKWVD